MASAVLSFFLLSKIKQIFCGNRKDVTNIKNNIQRYSTISRFNAAHMCATNIQFLR